MTTSTTPRRISNRIGSIAESATLAVDAKAKALKAAGRPVIGFGAGEPDFPTPPAIVAAAAAACADPRNHRYTPAAGLPELREAIAAKTRRDTGLEVAASQVLVTNGGKQAVYQAFATLVDPGDEVLLPAPYWTTYPEAIALAGGTPVIVQCGPEADYLPSVEQLEAARTERTKALLLVLAVQPDRRGGLSGADRGGRPVGRRARHLGDHRRDLRAPDLRRRRGGVDAGGGARAGRSCVVLNGVAKTYAMTGWRVGWLIGPADVIKAATNLQSHLSSNVCNVSQRAALEAVSGSLDAVAEMRTAFDRRRQTIVELLSARSRASSARPRGARSTPTRRCARCWARRSAALGRRRQRRAGRTGAGARRGGGGAGRGVRHARATSGSPTPSATTTCATGVQRMGDLLPEAR